MKGEATLGGVAMNHFTGERRKEVLQCWWNGAASSERHVGVLCVFEWLSFRVSPYTNTDFACTRTHSSGQKQVGPAGVNHSWVESRGCSLHKKKKSLLKILYPENIIIILLYYILKKLYPEKIWISALLWRLRPWDLSSFAPSGLSIGE